MKATAAVLRSPEGPYTLEEVSLPPLGCGEALIRIIAAGLCHTDLLARGPGPFGRPPIVLGHEGAGIVEQVGPAVADVRPGDHVVLSFHACGECARCKNGRPSYCARFFELNFLGSPPGAPVATDADGRSVSSRWFGQSSFATHAVVSASSLVTVDPTLPLERLAPLGCSVLTGASSILHALAVPAGASVAVIGSGAVGLAAVMAADVAGAVVCAVDRNPERLAQAQRYGAAATVDVSACEPRGLSERLREIAPDGLDYCLDTTGAPEVIAAAVEALSPVGVCGLLGSPRGDLTLGRMALASGRTVRGLLFGDATPRLVLPELIALWQDGRLPFDELIATYPLDRIGDAEADFTAGRVVKPVLLPGG